MVDLPWLTLYSLVEDDSVRLCVSYNFVEKKRCMCVLKERYVNVLEKLYERRRPVFHNTIYTKTFV